MTLGKTITRHREAAGLSIGECARRTKVAKSLLLYWERDEKVPTPASVQRLASVLAVDFESLFVLAGHAAPGNLPGLPTYLRKKHNLSKSDTERVERYVARIKAQKGGRRAKRDR